MPSQPARCGRTLLAFTLPSLLSSRGWDGGKREQRKQQKQGVEEGEDYERADGIDDAVEDVE